MRIKARSHIVSEKCILKMYTEVVQDLENNQKVLIICSPVLFQNKTSRNIAILYSNSTQEILLKPG
jgi:hypothetical protein